MIMGVMFTQMNASFVDVLKDGQTLKKLLGRIKQVWNFFSIHFATMYSIALTEQFSYISLDCRCSFRKATIGSSISFCQRLISGRVRTNLSHELRHGMMLPPSLL